MPKWTKFFVGWALAALFAVALSWGAVAQVRNRVIQPSTPIPATSLAAAEPGVDSQTTPTVIRLEPEVEGGETATTVTVDVVAGSTTSTQSPNSSATTAPDVSDDQPTSSTSVTTTTSGTSASTTTSTTTTTSAPAPVTTTTTTTTAAPTTQTSSYQLLGGEVTISYSPGVVNFISAFPQAGYSTDIREYGPDEVRVRFESSDHTSDFRARWENGQLQITKNETGDD